MERQTHARPDTQHTDAQCSREDNTDARRTGDIPRDAGYGVR